MTNTFSFTPFPILTTARLKLRQINVDDTEALLTLRNNDDVNKYIDRPKQTTTADLEKFYQKISTGVTENKLMYWAICLKNSEQLIGTVCMFNFSEDKRVAEVGYELSPAYQGKGIMDEALKCVIAYAQTLKLKSLEAEIHQANISSAKLAAKNNFITISGDHKNDSYVVWKLNLPPS